VNAAQARVAVDRDDAADAATVALLTHLRDTGYHFVTPSPATHARVIARADRQTARSTRDVLGWSLPFAREAIDPEVVRLLAQADAIEALADGRLRSRLRVSSLGQRLFAHSAYPTDSEDAVFFGPDSYRFADLIAAELAAGACRPGARIIDIGTGSGVGAIVAAASCPDARIATTDVNPAALRLARINARAAGLSIEAIETDGLTGVPQGIDLALANPPYIIDDGKRVYRDGGGMHGAQISLDMTRAAVERLAPGGRVVLYTGSAIVDGADALHDALATLAAERGDTLRYREIDPDVFGEELDAPAYAEVDRIAVVAAVIRRPE
jgi:methylase of polypeptide subunit release factors